MYVQVKRRPSAAMLSHVSPLLLAKYRITRIAFRVPAPSYLLSNTYVADSYPVTTNKVLSDYFKAAALIKVLSRGR
jgi:hypothetical protein